MAKAQGYYTVNNIGTTFLSEIFCFSCAVKIAVGSKEGDDIDIHFESSNEYFHPNCAGCQKPILDSVEI